MKINSTKIIGLTSLFISISTLIILLYEINLTRRQQYASVLPYISFENYGMYSENYRFRIRNSGLGPGFVTEVNIIQNNIEYKEDPFMFLQRLNLPYADSMRISYSNMYPGRLIAPGEHIDLIMAHDRQTGDSLIRILNDPNVLFEIKYKSVYDEEWRITNDMTTPQKIE